MTPLPDRTGGPARYVRIAETGGRLGFITPLTHNFCESCNRGAPDLHGQALHVASVKRRGRSPGRAPRLASTDALVTQAVIDAIARKPRATTSSSSGRARPPSRPHECHRRISFW